jgi:hypothetical protein
MERSIELSISEPAQAMAHDLSRRGRNRRYSCEPCEGGLAAESTWVRPSTEKDCRTDGANPKELKEVRPPGPDDGHHGPLVLARLGFEPTITAGQRPQGRDHRRGLGIGPVG